MNWGKDITFIRKIPIKSYPYESILRQFTCKNLFLKSLYLRKKTLLYQQIKGQFSMIIFLTKNNYYIASMKYLTKILQIVWCNKKCKLRKNKQIQQGASLDVSGINVTS